MSKDNSEVIAAAAADSVKDLVTQHWPQIESALEQSGKSKISVAVALKFQRESQAQYRLDAKISYGVKQTDEREDRIEVDADQGKLFDPATGKVSRKETRA